MPPQRPHSPGPAGPPGPMGPPGPPGSFGITFGGAHPPPVMRRVFIENGAAVSKSTTLTALTSKGGGPDCYSERSVRQAGEVYNDYGNWTLHIEPLKVGPASTPIPAGFAVLGKQVSLPAQRRGEDIVTNNALPVVVMHFPSLCKTCPRSSLTGTATSSFSRSPTFTGYTYF